MWLWNPPQDNTTGEKWMQSMLTAAAGQQSCNTNKERSSSKAGRWLALKQAGWLWNWLPGFKAGCELWTGPYIHTCTFHTIVHFIFVRDNPNSKSFVWKNSSWRFQMKILYAENISNALFFFHDDCRKCLSAYFERNCVKGLCAWFVIHCSKHSYDRRQQWNRWENQTD